MLTVLPNLITERLILRAFSLSDSADVQRLAGEKEVAATTLLIPHPYPDGAAEEWISSHAGQVQRGEQYVFAITDQGTGELMGAIGLGRNSTHNKAELGYWVGVDFWGRGYCSEAARAIVHFGFESLGLNRIHSCHFLTNPASGRVLQKAGLKYEGLLRQDYYKWGEYVDSAVYGLTRDEYEHKP